jgi:hypothetical protein
MRQLVIDKLNELVKNGAELFYDFDCGAPVDPEDIPNLTDEELLEIFENAIGFGG